MSKPTTPPPIKSPAIQYNECLAAHRRGEPNAFASFDAVFVHGRPPSRRGPSLDHALGFSRRAPSLDHALGFDRPRRRDAIDPNTPTPVANPSNPEQIVEVARWVAQLVEKALAAESVDPTVEAYASSIAGGSAPSDEDEDAAESEDPNELVEITNPSNAEITAIVPRWVAALIELESESSGDPIVDGYAAALSRSMPASTSPALARARAMSR